MWHQQPRVGKMRDHVQLAREQGLQGVAAIHWRTAETRYNFRTFARYARTSDDATVETLYKEYFEEDFGAQAAAALAPLMAAVDTANAWEGPQSPEYFAFRPDWGVLDEANAASRQGIIDAIDAVLNYEVHDYLFFCARATFDGYHNFAKTLREHNKNARAYSDELNRRKIK